MLNYAYNAPQGMSLADLAAGVQNDPAFQEMLRQEELRKEEERRRLAMEAAQQGQVMQVSDLMNQGYRPDTSKEYGPGGVPMVGPSGQRVVGTAAQPFDKTAELDQKYQAWRDRTLRDIVNYGASETNPAAVAEQMKLYDQIAGRLSPREKAIQDLKMQQIAARTAKVDSAEKLKNDRLEVLAKLAKEGMTLDANDQMVPLQGVVPPEQKVGSPEWKRIQEDEAAKAKVKADQEKLAQKEKGAATYLQGQQAAMQRQLADIAGLNVAEFTPEQLATYYGQGAPRQGEAVDRIESAVGVIDSLIPQIFRSQNKQDVLAGINSLKEVAQTFGLQQLRSAGVAPGSVTEREWSKFEQMLGNLDPSQSGDRMYNQLRQIYKQLETAKSSLAPTQPQSEQPAAAAGPTPGTVKNGYVFLGGNPADKNSWKPVGGQ